LETKKNIAFVIGSLSSGGAERVISTLSNNLIEKYNIIIITFIKSDPFYKLDSRIRVIHCQENINTPASIIGSLRLNYNLVKQISRIFKSEKINISIGFITSANILTVIASKINRIPCIISERNNPLIENVPKLWILLRKFVYPLADSLVLQTQGVKKIYEKKIKHDKLNILPNPISSELSILRKNKSVKKKIILSVGRLDKNKCHDILINAFNKVQQNDWKVIIIGTGNEKVKLDNLISINNLAKKVKIISNVKNIHDYYNEAAIFVFTSRTEGFPNALLEAMYFGIPTISTNCDFGPSDLIDDGINGYLIPIENQIELEKRLSKLIDNEELRNTFSTKSKLSTENYLSNIVTNKWEALIQQLLKRNKN
tara:strand:+ start:3350 stop:4459 length:1110 start_codon:yes stop_codon:yes gene_type:complete